ncbi:E3 ubiquitin-protein ligase Ubr3 [Amphibalanus amphitrite]|uniref:E3 ubiquitin-protein ligase n=1 Tax=Amphibalanus amphitrite TaxID=1232801 RepID=A0A6A4V672_AMPAM|nr:E3 ubiquitin-protein ligase Ubr3 [Amphibalanus amphitrite]
MRRAMRRADSAPATDDRPSLNRLGDGHAGRPATDAMVDPKKTAVKEDEEPVTAEALERRGKRWAANFLKREPSPRLLHQLLDKLLSPLKPISDENIVEWMRWIMAADKTPEEFAEQVRSYDNAQRCGMVWTANFVAYRCRTCGISPCMSLCAECFQRGNHDGHDYNMFWSQAGGACDCGDPYVMKPSGFCSLHGQTDPAAQRGPPDSLMQLPREMMPRIFSRLLVYLRINSRAENMESNDASIMQRLDGYLNFLQDLCNMRTAMRACMTEALTSRELYRDMDLVQITQDDAHGETKLLREAYRNYVEAVNSMPNPDVAPELRALSPALQENIQHETMLDELVFWTYKYEFPYQAGLPAPLHAARSAECFTRAFVLHYARISQMLSASTDPDPLTNRVVHVSVQLFSNEQLALRMTEELHLLHAMVISLKHMTSQILINSQLHDPARNTHKVASCGDKIMKNHCYWPLVSDLSNVLSHKPVALAFVSDDGLLQMWFSYLSMYQGMHVNIRQLDAHVDMEPSTYYAAFSAELEGSAAPMWALLTHLKEPGTADLTKRLLRHAYAALQQWHDAIGCPQTYEEIVEDDSMDLRCTFHLPLHRYVALIISEAVKRQGVSLQELLPTGNTMFTLISHLLKLQASDGFHEISAGMWVRNGNQMKGQTMTYTQCHFCCSMVDPDIYLLQLGAMTLDPDKFLTLVLKKFHVWEWLSFAPNATNSHLEADQEIPMVEACLTFLATLLCVRTCAGMPEDELAKLEIATQLCMGDKTHSQLMDLLPEKSEPMSNPALFEAVLAHVSRYRGPASEASGNMQQGIYGPKVEVWDTLYDPIYVFLRAMVRKEFQGSMDRFTAYVKSTGQYTDSKGSPWPPYKVPPSQPPLPDIPDVRRILHCNTFYGAMLAILRRCVSDPLVSEQVMSLAIFLLEMATRKPEKEFTGQEVFRTDMDQPDECEDLQFTEWFRTPWSVDNLRRVVDNVTVVTERVYPSSSSSESDEMLMESMEMVVEEPEDEDVGVLHLSPDGPPPLAALQTQQRPALLAGTEVGRLPPSEPMDQSAAGGSGAAHAGAVASTSAAGAVGEQQYSGPLALVACSGGELVPRSQQGDLLLRSPASHDMGESWYGPRGLQDGAGPSSTTTTTSVAFGDSIVSLLLKLHSKLSDQPDSYRLPSDEQLANFKESRVGNGPHFVGQLLTFIAKKDPLLKQHIKETRNRLWPRATEDESPRSEDREARRRMARERQQRLMRQFANRQRQFQEQLETEEPDVAASSRRERNVREYDCVIAARALRARPERPFGLVVLLQATSVLSHQHTRTEPLQLPVDEESSQQLRSRLRHNRAAFVDSRHDRLASTFENVSVSDNYWGRRGAGWDGIG